MATVNTKKSNSTQTFDNGSDKFFGVKNLKFGSTKITSDVGVKIGTTEVWTVKYDKTVVFQRGLSITATYEITLGFTNLGLYASNKYNTNIRTVISNVKLNHSYYQDIHIRAFSAGYNGLSLQDSVSSNTLKIAAGSTSNTGSVSVTADFQAQKGFWGRGGFKIYDANLTEMPYVVICYEDNADCTSGLCITGNDNPCNSGKNISCSECISGKSTECTSGKTADQIQPQPEPQIDPKPIITFSDCICQGNSNADIIRLGEGGTWTDNNGVVHTISKEDYDYAVDVRDTNNKCGKYSGKCISTDSTLTGDALKNQQAGCGGSTQGNSPSKDPNCISYFGK